MTIPQFTARPVPAAIRPALLVVLGSLFIAALAQIAIPVGPVPISGQTLAVLLVAVALGPRRGTLAVLLYLAQGLAGMPVFAGGTAGPAVLLGPTAGYLVGFIPGAWIAGQISSRGSGGWPARDALIIVTATLVIYVCGAAWLMRFVGVDAVLQTGVIPFVPGDAIKAAIVLMAVPMLRRAA